MNEQKQLKQFAENMKMEFAVKAVSIYKNSEKLFGNSLDNASVRAGSFCAINYNYSVKKSFKNEAFFISTCYFLIITSLTYPKVSEQDQL